MSHEVQPPHPSPLKIGAIGCAGLLAVVLLVVGGIVALTYRVYEKELTLREELDRRHGPYDSYRVPADGTIPPDRLARFLAVRRRLMPRCPEVTDIAQAFRRMESIAGSDEPDVGDGLRHAGQVLRWMPRLGLVFGAYINDRNDALLERGIGLGEYSWIYVVGYFAFLEQTPRRLFEEPTRLKVFEDRVYPEIAKVIARHVAETLMTAGPWVEELTRLKADRRRVPFAGTIPPELAGSLEASRAALEAAACPAAAELDMTVTVRRGVIGYDHR